MLYKVIDVRDSAEPVAEALDRVGVHLTSFEARQALYGPETRSGHVHRIEPELPWCDWEWTDFTSPHSVKA